MQDIIDKRTRADGFRARLAQAMGDSGLSQSALARRIGVDRSTISQLLTGDGPRLPNAHVIGSAATALGVSSDWLLGLSDRPERAADLLANSLGLAETARAPVDEQIQAWHQEAQGYKIRHVPAALPDMLKCDALLAWEYSPHLGRTAAQAIGAATDRLDWMRRSQSDYEIAMPLYELTSFASATGYYEGLPADIRHAQIDHFLDLAEQLYPRLRLYLFDAKRLYAAPVTIFGPLLCVFYTGGHFMSFRDRERIDLFTRNFDLLVRESALTARLVPTHLRALRHRIG
ncbi:helix-turn-helix domain-containing protein [Marinibacterium sp. SX1]|uniref:helix-turn-helix domain-containing protein n=1 Tax=Marinibacterium sp. SX1 TaxID=3388424 RepID=UPI003D16965F